MDDHGFTGEYVMVKIKSNGFIEIEWPGKAGNVGASIFWTPETVRDYVYRCTRNGWVTCRQEVDGCHRFTSVYEYRIKGWREVYEELMEELWCGCEDPEIADDFTAEDAREEALELLRNEETGRVKTLCQTLVSIVDGMNEKNN